MTSDKRNTPVKTCPRCGVKEGELCRDYNHMKQECNDRSTDAYDEVLEFAEQWKGVHTDESYGPQGRVLGLLAREVLALRRPTPSTQPSSEARAVVVADPDSAWHDWRVANEDGSIYEAF